MPLNGNTYVAPVWRNGQPPALDPTELQAISDSIVRNQTDNANQDSLIAALQTAVGSLQAGSAKIEVGSYVGTGTYGVSNPNSITCSFAPKVLIITVGSGSNSAGVAYLWGIWVYNNSNFYNGSNANNGVSYFWNPVNLIGNTISWYNQRDSAFQLNYGATKYYYTFLG